MTQLAPNPELAARAVAAAAAAAHGSAARRAWNCVAVSLTTTSSVRAASKALAEMDPGTARAAAIRYLTAIRDEAAENT